VRSCAPTRVSICSALLLGCLAGCTGGGSDSKTVADSFLCVFFGCDYTSLCTQTGDPFWCGLAEMPVPQPVPPPIVCEPTETPVELTCDDGLDNDCDGLIDNQDPDCPHLCGDINRDGVVDELDSDLINACFGRAGPGEGCDEDAFAGSDLNGDGRVTLPDMATFALWFGLPPTGTPPNCAP